MICVEIKNHFQLIVTSDSPDPVALYLYRNGEIVEKVGYRLFTKHLFPLNRAGKYQVAWFSRSSDGTIRRGTSDLKVFRGYSGLENAVKHSHQFALWGVNKYTLYAAHVLKTKADVLGIVDPTGKLAGTSIFDFPIITESQVPDTAKLLEYSTDLFDSNEINHFSLLPQRHDPVSKTLALLGIMELYRLSRMLYLEGMEEGAKHIQGFIFNKFNSRVPYLAEIGEGTRIGIGGIGVVIHPNSVIGRDCVIGQQVTLGGRVGGAGTPIIGDNVWISPGAKCLGGRIGSNVVIGANSVVLKEVESNSVVAGVPARLISRDIEKYSTYTTPKK